MVTIIKRENKHIKANPLYRITCSNCGTEFMSNQSDCHHVSADQGFWCWGINCPNCGNVCREHFYSDDKWETIKED